MQHLIIGATPIIGGMHVDRCLHSPRTCAVTAFLVEIVHCRTHSIWTQFPLISKVVIGCVIWQIAWRRITEIKGDTRNGFLNKSSISSFFQCKRAISISRVSCFDFSLTNLKFKIDWHQHYMHSSIPGLNLCATRIFHRPILISLGAQQKNMNARIVLLGAHRSATNSSFIRFICIHVFVKISNQARFCL